MTLIRSAHTGEDPPSTVRLRERLEARLSALAAAMARRNSETLDREVEQIRSEAAEQLAAQCRQLAQLSRTVAAAEAARDARLSTLERDLREKLEQAAPPPLAIPRPRNAVSTSVADLWSARD